MERRQHYNEQPGATGEMTVEFDVASGRIRSRGRGFWSKEQASSFFVDWRRVIQRVHAEGVSVSALVDMSDGVVQMAEVTDIIASATKGLYRTGDAIAMFIPTGLITMQMRRVLDQTYHEFFAAETAAEHWLETMARHRPSQRLRRCANGSTL